MGTCNLVLSSTFRPQYDGYVISDPRVRVYCDGDYLTSLEIGEVKKITIESGSHIFQFTATFFFFPIGDDEEWEREWESEWADFIDSKIVDLPSERQYALLEEDLMIQFEKWRDKREKESEEFLQKISEGGEKAGQILADFIKEMYH